MHAKSDVCTYAKRVYAYSVLHLFLQSYRSCIFSNFKNQLFCIAFNLGFSFYSEAAASGKKGFEVQASPQTIQV